MSTKKVASGKISRKRTSASPPNSDRLTFFFDQGSARIREQDAPKLTSLAQVLRRNPDALLWIRGFTVGSGSDDHNKRLGSKRARAVANELIRLGIADERIITASGARKRPVDKLLSIDRRRRRRAETSLMDGTTVTAPTPKILTEVWLRQRPTRVPATA
ncbi:MAG: OmpA family protein [Steroidobacteraceae bacterium]